MWDVTQCSLVEDRYQGSGKTCCFISCTWKSVGSDSSQLGLSEPTGSNDSFLQKWIRIHCKSVEGGEER